MPKKQKLLVVFDEFQEIDKYTDPGFEKRKISIASDIITDIVERCEYQLMYILQFLFELWRQGEISSATISQIESDFLERRGNEFIILWDSLTPNQRKALRLLAKTDGEAIRFLRLLLLPYL